MDSPPQYSEEEAVRQQQEALDRIEHIDDVVAQIVSGGVPLASFMLALVGAIFVFYSQKQALSGQQVAMLHALMTVFGFGGFTVNFIIALNLSRQEYIRRYYMFHRKGATAQCPDGKKALEIQPPEGWLPKPPKPGDTKGLFAVLNENAKKVIYRGGRAAPGYVILWTELFTVVGTLFLIFGLFNWLL